MTPRRRRQTRAATLAASLATLTVAGHAAGGGDLPGVAGLAMIVLLSTGLAQLLATRRLRPVPVLALLLTGQGLGHVVLTLTGHHGAANGAAGGPSASTMLVAHVVAAALAALVLVHADRLVDGWLALVATLLGAPALALPATRGPRPARPTHRVLRPVTGTLQHHLVRRGPPAMASLT